MFLELFNFFSDSFGPLRVFEYLSFRAIFAALTALLISLTLGPIFINKMHSIQVGQVVRQEGPSTHLEKVGTPTMGGTLILASIFLSTLMWGDLQNKYLWVAIFVTIFFGLLGWVDDLLKIKFNSSKGLSAPSKIFWQSIITLIAVSFLFYTSSKIEETSLIVPFFKNISIPLGFGYIFLSYIVIISASNSVNLTDGLDGLATVPVMLVALSFTLICYVVGNTVFSEYLQIPYIADVGESAIFCGSMVGACLGFLWYNAPPAKIFMGDTGSLSLGGSLGAVSIISKHEIVLGIIGGLFVLETVSVIIQVISFKLTGKRVFMMAPLHHHFEKKGWAESTVVIRFWIISIILALIGLATLKLR